MDRKREELMFGLANELAEEKHGTLDLTMEQWARIYDAVEDRYGDLDTHALRVHQHDFTEHDVPFSLSCWLADTVGLDDDFMSHRSWEQVDDFVVSHLAHLTNGALFKAPVAFAEKALDGAPLPQ